MGFSAWQRARSPRRSESDFAGWLHASLASSRWSSSERQRAHPHQIRSDHRQTEVLADALESTVHRLHQAADGLAPAKVLVDLFTLALAQDVSLVPRGPSVDAAAAVAAAVASDVRA